MNFVSFFEVNFRLRLAGERKIQFLYRQAHITALIHFYNPKNQLKSTIQASQCEILMLSRVL